MAILPGLFLVWYVYQQDKIEKEPFDLLRSLFVFGALTVFAGMILENVLIDGIISIFFNKKSLAGLIVINFLGVAFVEEFLKYKVLKSKTWTHPAFDYRFDAIVYAVAAGMGFAVLENIFYVFENGMDVAIVRALTSLPGHCVFAIYMGYYYGEAKWCSVRGNRSGMSSNLFKALWIPVLIHGFYDLCLAEELGLILVFFIYVIIMDIKAYRLLKSASASDRHL